MASRTAASEEPAVAEIAAIAETSRHSGVLHAAVRKCQQSGRVLLDDLKAEVRVIDHFGVVGDIHASNNKRQERCQRYHCEHYEFYLEFFDHDGPVCDCLLILL